MARSGKLTVKSRERGDGRAKREHGLAGVTASYSRETRPEMAWWDGEHDDAYQRVVRVAKMLLAAQQQRRMRLREYERLYRAHSSTPFMRGPGDRLSRRLTLNGVRSCVNTACAKVGKSKPKPQFLTIDGDWSIQQRAKNLTAYLEGLFDEIRIYDIEENVFRDAVCFDIGTMHFRKTTKTIAGKIKKRLCCERVLPDELLINDAESYYGMPRQMLRRYFVDRAQLMAMFMDGGVYYDETLSNTEREEILDKIKSSPQASLDSIERFEGNSMAEVIEGWHLPSAPTHDGEDTDGCHTFCIESATLIYEKYEKPYYPFVFMYWERPVVGFFGTGLSEELAGIQYELNEALKRVQIAQRHACAPKVLVPTGAKIAKSKLGNDLRVEIVNYDGAIPPTFLTPNAMPTEVYQWIENLWHKMFETTGISQMTAASHKPAGLNSGVALREFEDIESERFVLVGQRREQFFMDAAKMLIDMSRDLYEEDRGLAVTGYAGKLVNRIKWADVDLDEDQYTMRAFPVSLLPSTPAGKLQKVTELMQNGLIDREQGLELLDFPDVEKFTGLATAALEDAQMIVDSMANGGDYIPPEPFMDLALSKKLAVSTYLRARTRKVDEKNIDKLRQFIGECDRLMDMALAQEQAKAGPPPMPPGPPAPPQLPPGPPGPPPGPPPMPMAPPQQMPLQ